MMRTALDRSITPPPGPLRPFEFGEIRTFTLGNGIPVLFRKTDGMPVTTVSVIQPSGAIREDAGQAGLATLTGHLLESGTDRMTAPRIAEALESLGVRLNVSTSWEVSSVDVTALTSRVGEGLDLAAHLITQSNFPESEVARLRDQQLTGILQRRADPGQLASEMSNRYIFAPDSPFSRPASGTPETVGSLTRSDVVAYHRNAFTPRGAAIVVAGNIDEEAAREVAERAFGRWDGDPPPAQAGVARPREPGGQVVIVDRPGSVQSEIRIGHIGVPRNTPDFFPLLVMNTILGGAFSSRLNLNLREKHGFTYGVSSAFVMRRQPGPFVVATAVQTEVTGAAIREIHLELNRIREETVTGPELTDARNYLAGTFPLRLQTTDGVASRLAELLIYDLPHSYVDEYAERVLAVSDGEVLAVARDRIHPDQMTVLVVGDAAMVRPQVEALELGPIEVVSGEGVA